MCSLLVRIEAGTPAHGNRRSSLGRLRPSETWARTRAGSRRFDGFGASRTTFCMCRSSTLGTSSSSIVVQHLAWCGSSVGITQNVLVSDPHDRLFTGRLRVMQYLSDACILFACIVFALLVGKHWAWGPCVVAAGIVTVSAGANALMVHMATKRFQLTDEQRRRAAARRRTRNTVIVPSFVTFGIGFGLIAGSLRSYWADVVLGVFILGVTVLLPLLMWPTISRRAAAQRSARPGDAL